MSVPGPGHSEQEQELHKSLLRDDDDLDSEVEGAMAPGKCLLFVVSHSDGYLGKRFWDGDFGMYRQKIVS
ncbi:hypothetical protein ANCDUO_15381 [Ancylostoma duodenale]|uniref:Uncharacterized protein n=1 Tax=Ancylostoma duodenale TaxID=51022 RepID=A0A0C2CDS2_9BILA|nr:hypothetical protein ANCDUO_15381 [Ancylostoma duodenale]